ncbi:MAG: ComEC/Rec2 family competence protein, partial [Actinomycetota bacterium]
ERALAGLDGLQEGDVAAAVTLLTDPRPQLGGIVRAEARLGHRRVEVQAANVAAAALAPRLAGEVVRVRGTVAPLPRPTDWSRSRHLAGRLRVLRVEDWAPGHRPAALANGLRRSLVAGTGSMGSAERSLFTGLVVGDDRQQPLALADDFEGAGLTHLLAVSGQNVAFVLALASPLLRRLRLWPRLVLAIALIGLFAAVTRFEPSVLRASAMAAVALVATTAGRALARMQVLGLALAALLLVDPLLVRSVGFQLSAAATAAIVVLAAPLEGVLPGPRWMRAPLALTTAAQLGVAPILVATFGPLPVASLPANLLAVPAAGLIMAWGLTGGLLAGAAVSAGLPGATTLAAVLHLPTRLLLAWVAEVAGRSAALPLGQLHGSHLVAIGLALAVALVLSRRRGTTTTVEGPGEGGGRRRRAARVAVGAGGAVLLAAVLSAQAGPGLRTQLLPGAVRWHAEGTDVLVLGGVGGRIRIPADALLERLRETGVGALDLVVLADEGVPGSLLEVVAGRHPVGAAVVHGVALPEPMTSDRIDVVGAPTRPQTVPVGRLEVRLTPTADRVVVDARRAR